MSAQDGLPSPSKKPRIEQDSVSEAMSKAVVESVNGVRGTVVQTESVNAAPDEVGVEEQWIHLAFSWAGKPYTLDIAESDRVFDLKAALFSLTNVPPDRQKILGLVKGKLPPDEERVGDLKIVSGKKFTLIGTPEGDEIKDPSQLEFLPDVVNDLDVDFSADPAAAAAYQNDLRNIRKVREATKKLKVNIINPLREGKKLLVLDIDYTILDTKPLTSGALPPAECARPHLHEFLTAVYPHYDICIWSQTSWVWLETKLVELGMLGANRNYKISFVLDKTSMFTVFSKRDGKPYTHSVKALQIIWNHFPQFHGKNTIHVDDLGRNFALNPKQGLKISAFKDAHTPQAMADRELDKLARYMLYIAAQEDLEKVNHKDWKRIVRALPPHGALPPPS
ncbi:HAD IIID h [Dentipellis sp. KUC8613]|nr:HAD IIID h [Dentipellis sp. KUC8613]